MAAACTRQASTDARRAAAARWAWSARRATVTDRDHTAQSRVARARHERRDVSMHLALRSARMAPRRAAASACLLAVRAATARAQLERRNAAAAARRRWPRAKAVTCMRRCIRARPASRSPCEWPPAPLRARRRTRRLGREHTVPGRARVPRASTQRTMAGLVDTAASTTCFSSGPTHAGTPWDAMAMVWTPASAACGGPAVSALTDTECGGGGVWTPTSQAWAAAMSNRRRGMSTPAPVRTM
mmetsp:Transcript_6476/g.19190  ORF Transcript_6476/g.19190 Transcript_6476/m.19190 type:complete len:243 (-) Transcript_6476:608-1336(-)